MKEMVIYNITALLIIGVSILCFTKIRTGLTNKNLRRVLEVFLLILAAGTILTIAFLALAVPLILRAIGRGQVLSQVAGDED